MMEKMENKLKTLKTLHYVSCDDVRTKVFLNVKCYMVKDEYRDKRIQLAEFHPGLGQKGKTLYYYPEFWLTSKKKAYETAIKSVVDGMNRCLNTLDFGKKTLANLKKEARK